MHTCVCLKLMNEKCLRSEGSRTVYVHKRKLSHIFLSPYLRYNFYCTF